jgi:exodeoxyribonuclease III
VKIISWNVNGIRACYSKGLREFIDRTRPDIFCVQETKAGKERVDLQLQKLGFADAYWSSSVRNGYSGVATFCRQSASDVCYNLGVAKFDVEGRVVVTSHKQFDLYNIYFPNGASSVERHLYKQEFLHLINHHFRNELSKGKELIVVGDFNIAHQEIDIFDPAGLANTSGFLVEERAWFDRFLALGFTDSFRYLHGQESDRYSWWSYRQFARMGNLGWRLDYICVSKGLLTSIGHAEILDKVTGSDHCPVILELDLA